MWCQSLTTYLTRFVIIAPIRNKAATTIARILVDRVFSVFGVPEMLCSDQGTEFENQLVRELQTVFGYKKTRTTPYRPQCKSVLERVHSTMHNMLDMYMTLLTKPGHNSFLPFVQIAHNTAYSSTIQDTLLPHVWSHAHASHWHHDGNAELPDTALQYTRKTVENCSLRTN